jgi:hypothetical protein
MQHTTDNQPDESAANARQKGETHMTNPTTTKPRDLAILNQLAYAHSQATVAAIDAQMTGAELVTKAVTVAMTIDEIAAQVAIGYMRFSAGLRLLAGLLPSRWRAGFDRFFDDLDVLSAKVNPDFKAGKDV